MENTSTSNGTENQEIESASMRTRELEEDYLWDLQRSLAGRGVLFQLVTPERRSIFLNVKSKPPDSREVDIWVALADGVWWFWWGVQWAQRLGRADDPDGAAETVLRKLGGGQ